MPTIADRLELEAAPMAIGGKRLLLNRVRNIDPLIDALTGSPADQIRRFPLWVKVWEAAIVLTDHLLKKGLPPGTRVLEIGAGMGVTGLFLGACGLSVTITDFEPDALELLRMNADANGLSTVTVRPLDWFHPELEGTFDLICGSEVVYHPGAAEPILGLLSRFLAPGGSAVLAHAADRSTLFPFLAKAEAFFSVETLPRTLRGGDQVHRILLHHLRPKEGGRS